MHLSEHGRRRLEESEFPEHGLVERPPSSSDIMAPLTFAFVHTALTSRSTYPEVTEFGVGSTKNERVRVKSGKKRVVLQIRHGRRFRPVKSVPKTSLFSMHSVPQTFRGFHSVENIQVYGMPCSGRYSTHSRNDKTDSKSADFRTRQMTDPL